MSIYYKEGRKKLQKQNEVGYYYALCYKTFKIQGSILHG